MTRQEEINHPLIKNAIKLDIVDEESGKNNFWEISEKYEDVTMSLKSKDGFYKAFVKWDGCIDLTKHDNTEASDYIHICDLNEHIEILQELKKIAIENFGKEWVDE